jgi:hypothetical protein
MPYLCEFTSWLTQDHYVQFLPLSLCEVHPNSCNNCTIHVYIICTRAAHQMNMQAGCPFPTNRIVMATCEEKMLGCYTGIDSLGLLICQNHYPEIPDVLRNTLLHELVHAYDECRGKNLDWLNCKHLACSEVRNFFPNFKFACKQIPVLVN